MTKPNNEFIIGERKIGSQYKPLVIAEIGINHEGDIDKAKLMIDDAYKAGAEVVKFQSHVIEDEMIPEASNVIPGNADESIYDIMSRCAFNKEQEKELMCYTKELGMTYLSTPFSRAAADRLESLGVEAYKIGSGECNNYPLIAHIAKFGKPIILSTGMNNIDSIREAVKILENRRVPYALLHCVSMYPTPYEKVSLGAINELQEEFPNAIVGLSDHSMGNYTCFGSVMLGASILEKHFTSDKNWKGPDVPISIDPLELQDLIIGSEAVWKARGGRKGILEEEQETIDFAYACVVTTKPVAEGQILSEENTWVKRPGTGEIKAKEYNAVLGKIATQNIPSHVHVKWSMITS